MARFSRGTVFAFLGAAVVLATLAGFWRPVSQGVRYVFLPAIRLVSSTASFFFPGGPSHEDADRITELESRLANVTVDYVKLRSLEEENRTLRAEAHFLETSGYDSVGARVISRDVRDQRALLLVDRGQADNVEIGQAVVTDEGVFIGKVTGLSERVATIELLTDPHSRVAAAFGNKADLLGVVEGRGSGAAVLTYIPPNQGLKRDDIIVTAGTEEKIPANIPIGLVNVVEGKPTDPFLNASLEPLAPLDRVVFVSILRPSALRPAL